MTKHKSRFYLSLLIICLAVFSFWYYQDYKTAQIEAEKNNAIPEIKVTIPEGYSINDIAEVLDEKQIIKEKDFLTVVNNKKNWPTSWNTNWFIKFAQDSNKTLEGFFFPDTYRFFTNSSAEEIGNVFFKNFNNRTKTLATLSPEKKYQIIILASILEKEVQKKEDMKIVADILNKRVKNSMRLQVDSTLHYIKPTGQNKLSAEEVADKSVYNTYQHDGFPPTPIGNPGLNSITAAFEPLANSYYYFLTDKNNQVHYAKNFEEHKANKSKYLDN